VTQSPIRLSVVIPTTGNGHLGEIVASFLAEPIPAEVIVAVDRPDLDCSELEARFASDPRFVLVRNSRNLGLPRTLNRAIAAARDEIIVRNDDDEPPVSERLAKTLAYFEAHPDADIVFGFAIGREMTSGREWRIEGPTEEDAIKARLLEQNFIVHSTLAFRKARLAEIEFYDPTFLFAQDYALYLASIRAGLRFGAIPEPLVTRLYHPQSTTVARRRRQIMFSFAARLVHHAYTDGKPWGTILGYARLLMIPGWLRNLRRVLGHGR